MRFVRAFFDAQLLGPRAISHWVFGKPMPDDEFAAELAEVERVEDRIGKPTLRGDMLRFEKARRELVEALVKRREENE